MRRESDRRSDPVREAAVAILAAIQRESFEYFLHETNPANGLVIDKTCEDWPASIAAVGLALAADVGGWHSPSG